MDVLVDDCDKPLLAAHAWRVYNHGRASRPFRYAQAAHRGKTIYLHRLIAGAATGQVVDHINGDTLDNRRCNLRLVTHSENHANAPLMSRNTSGFKGVHWDGQRGKWFSKITVRQQQIALGRYDRLCDAVDAYDDAARENFGDKALTNAMMRDTTSCAPLAGGY